MTTGHPVADLLSSRKSNVTGRHIAMPVDRISGLTGLSAKAVRTRLKRLVASGLVEESTRLERRAHYAFGKQCGRMQRVKVCRWKGATEEE